MKIVCRLARSETQWKSLCILWMNQSLENNILLDDLDILIISMVIFLFYKTLYCLWEINPGIYSKESILVGNKILTIHSAGMN
jgi:hypothetical protein